MFGTAIGVYVVLVGTVFVMQRSLLYPAGRHQPSLTDAGVPDMVEVVTRTADGLDLTHWYRPPSDPSQPVLVVFHGNAGHIGDRVPKLAALFDAGFGILLCGYRGYGGNPGSPTEDDLTADARLVLDWLAGQGIAADRTVLYGESLGTGIAVKMAAERPVAAVVLESPYTSIAELAQVHYWYLPAWWLVLDKWRSIETIDRVTAPLLIVHGARDRTVPVRYGRRIFESAAQPKEILVVEDGAHNDLYDFPEVPGRVIEFLRRHLPGA